ncbi:fructokinase-like 2, chloroplastic [Cucurbita pepo subsp. pepo]|uniref:fructokinase-like 2, chloroplastic n=1 Tax=Cucurbita pepo subsp. pepo TaxID=3664 RepID=UPI000C9D6827|nr:fructokinase-like 2, chloroplastic [Cucurbita pepo subsp. pepo]
MFTASTFSQLLFIPRCESSLSFHCYPYLRLNQHQDLKLHNKWAVKAISKRKVSDSLAQDGLNDQEIAKKKSPRTPRSTTKRTRKKASEDAPNRNDELLSSVNETEVEENVVNASIEDSKTASRMSRSKAASTSTNVDDDKPVTKRRGRKPKKKDNSMELQLSESEVSDDENSSLIVNDVDESDEELDFGTDEGDDVSITYGWPPLVCCFGAAQHAFVPSGRPANRLLDYEIHDRMKDALWAPEKFVRAPGGSAGTVAIALSSLGGKVAFMGKLGDDDYGRAMLYYMNVNNVQTRSVRVDSKRGTATSQMKIGKRGRLKMTCIKPSAEDSLSKSEINIDVLKEAKMFYFGTHSLLDQSMRSTTMKAIKISRKLGGVIFYDLNLPLPLWNCRDETKKFIERVWNLADIIEVTKQELEFLCGIEPSEEFDTRNNDSSKFIHYEPEVIKPLWHENLKVLFVTNGTSKVHYYTEEHDGAILGMEDAPVTPFTSDMSASGDGIVAALMRMLSVQPHLVTDKGYLEHSIKYAINCGVIDQWLLGRTRGYPPEDDDTEEVTADENGIRSITEVEYRTVATVS